MNPSSGQDFWLGTAWSVILSLLASGTVSPSSDLEVLLGTGWIVILSLAGTVGRCHHVAVVAARQEKPHAAEDSWEPHEAGDDLSQVKPHASDDSHLKMTQEVAAEMYA